MWAIIPCKRLERAKQRLAGILSPMERSALVTAMLKDVLITVKNTSEIKGILVTSSDCRLRKIAANYQAKPFTYRSGKGLSIALTEASNHLSRLGASSLVVISSDLPLITSDSLSDVLSAISNRPSLAAVPADRDAGTNVLALRPPGIIPFLYGPKSFSRHINIAQKVSVKTTIIERPELGLDIDEPIDLYKFSNTNSNTKTYNYLASSGLLERLYSLDLTKATFQN